jgi:hypothetical protein
MPQVKFEPTTPVFQRAKRVHALDRAATVIGQQGTRNIRHQQRCKKVLIIFTKFINLDQILTKFWHQFRAKKILLLT